jgi:hypothetical protein
MRQVPFPNRGFTCPRNRDEDGLTHAFTLPYSHFFHLNIQYGTIAANSIRISAIG